MTTSRGFIPARSSPSTRTASPIRRNHQEAMANTLLVKRPKYPCKRQHHNWHLEYTNVESSRSTYIETLCKTIDRVSVPELANSSEFLSSHGLQQGMLSKSSLVEALKDRASRIKSCCGRKENSRVTCIDEMYRNGIDSWCEKTFPDIPFTLKGRRNMWHRHQQCCKQNDISDRFLCFRREAVLYPLAEETLNFMDDEIDPVNSLAEIVSLIEDYIADYNLVEVFFPATGEMSRQERSTVVIQRSSADKPRPLGAGSRSQDHHVFFSRKCVYQNLKPSSPSGKAMRKTGPFVFSLVLRNRSSSLDDQRNFSAVISSSPCGPGKLEFVGTDYQHNVVEPADVNCATILLTTTRKKMEKSPQLVWYPPLCGCVQFRAVVLESDDTYESDHYNDITGYLTTTMCIDVKNNRSIYIEALCSVVDQRYPPEIVSSPAYLQRYDTNMNPANLTRHHKRLLLTHRRIKDCCKNEDREGRERCLENHRIRRADEFCSDTNSAREVSLLRRTHMLYLAMRCCYKKGHKRHACMKTRRKITHHNAMATALDFSMDEMDLVNDLSNYARIDEDFGIFNMVTHIESRENFTAVRASHKPGSPKPSESKPSRPTVKAGASLLRLLNKASCEQRCALLNKDSKLCRDYCLEFRQTPWCEENCPKRLNATLSQTCKRRCWRKPTIETIRTICKDWLSVYGQCERDCKNNDDNKWCKNNCDRLPNEELYTFTWNRESPDVELAKEITHKQCCVSGAQYGKKLMDGSPRGQVTHTTCLVDEKTMNEHLLADVERSMKPDCLIEFQSCCNIIRSGSDWKAFSLLCVRSSRITIVMLISSHNLPV
ncbi:hypothetical protein PoB_001662000 [Plakobranchus ocellatus]|uniref:Uncharacterized protein n=1 Tax=Plakobranchus ocellatus TaxID=259542 RepID=A0AAV3Z6D5_9GAST|nr:hypothetical protein PoB_001662000 [Plakobranchus ocellatus]